MAFSIHDVNLVVNMVKIIGHYSKSQSNKDNYDSGATP